VPTVSQGTAAARLIDPDLHFDALSFDLKVRRPAPAGTGSSSSLQPYVSVGPALFVARPGEVIGLGLLAARREVSLSLGVLGGAGLSRRLGENTAPFGEDRVARSGSSRRLPIGERGALGRDADTADLRSGVSVRF
jgi:hypothetical protein